MATVIQASANGGFSSPNTWTNGVVPINNLYVADSYKYTINIDTNNISPITLTTSSSGNFILSSGFITINSNISAYNQPYSTLIVQGSSTYATISGSIYGGLSTNSIAFSLVSSASAFIIGNVYGGLFPSNAYGISANTNGFLSISGNCYSLLGNVFQTSASGRVGFSSISSYSITSPAIIFGNTGTLSITGNLSAGTSNTLLLQNSSNAIIYGNLYGGYTINPSNSSYALSSNSLGGNINIYGNIFSLSGTPNSLLSPISALSGISTSGALTYGSRLGFLTITGNLSTGTSTCVTLGGSVSANIYGNITGGPASNTIHGINSTSTGFLNVSGNVTAIRGFGINSTGSTASISVTGNITSGTIAAQSSRGISKTGTSGNVFVLGNIIGGPSGDVNNIGLFYGGGSTSNLTVYGTISAGIGHAIQTTTGTPTILVSGGNIYGGRGTSVYGIYANGSVNLICYSPVLGGTVGNGMGVNLNVAGSTATFYNYVSGSRGQAIYNNNNSNVNIIGNVYGGYNTAAVNNTNTGTISITGNIIGGGGTNNGVGVINSGTGVVNISGNVTGGSGTNTFGVNVTNTGVVNITGNIIGGFGTSSYGVNAANTASSIINIFGNLSASNNGLNSAPAIYLNNASPIISIYGNLNSNQFSNTIGTINSWGNINIYNDVIGSYPIISNNSPYCSISIYGNVIVSPNNSIGSLISTQGNLSISKNVITTSTNSNPAFNAITSTTNLTISGNIYAGKYANFSYGFVNLNITNFANYSPNIIIYGDIIGPIDGSYAIISTSSNTNTTYITTYKNIFNNSIGLNNNPHVITSYGNIIAYKNSPAISTGNNNTLYLDNLQCSETGYYPINMGDNSNVIFSPLLSSIITCYKGGLPTYNILGSNTNTVSSLPTISNISGSSSTLKTITFTSVHNLSSTAAVLSSSGFTDNSWNGVYGIASIPSPTQINVIGNFSSNPSIFGSSQIIAETGYYSGSGLVFTNNSHGLNTLDTVYSYSFYDSAFSWNGTFNVFVLSPSAFCIQGPTSIPLQYGMIVGTKYFSNVMVPSYASQITNIVPVPPSNVRSGYSYNSNTQTGNIIIPSNNDVSSDSYVDNQTGINILGSMVKVPTSSVRLNTVYGYLTGTMNVPDKKYVSYNVPVDNTLGTALLDATSLWNYPVSSVNNNTIGSKISNIASKSDIIAF